VQAGCEQLLQSVQTLVQEIGGALFAQRLCAATEQLRLAFEPALSRPAAPDEVECSVTPANPDEAALPLLYSMGQQALLFYRRLPEQDETRAQAVLQEGLRPAPTQSRQGPDGPMPTQSRQRRQSMEPRPEVTSAPPAPAELTHSEAFYHSLF